jgi:hypothetical protein
MRALGRLLPVLLAAGLLAGCGSEADRLVGNWQGSVDVGSKIPQLKRLGITTVQLGCHFQKGQDDQLTGTYDLPVQQIYGAPMDAVTIKDGAVHFEVKKTGGNFNGRLSKGGKEISGELRQAGAVFQLTLKKAE